jgi:hypothetical protein
MEMVEEHTHDTTPEGYFPPLEVQVDMLRQENVALNEANLNLRMQASFQAQVIEGLKKQITSGPPADVEAEAE